MPIYFYDDGDWGKTYVISNIIWGIFIFPVQLITSEQDWQPYPVDPYSAMCDGHTSMLYRRYFQPAHFMSIVGVRKRGGY